VKRRGAGGREEEGRRRGEKKRGEEEGRENDFTLEGNGI
jgi:hypothetical protein